MSMSHGSWAGATGQLVPPLVRELRVGTWQLDWELAGRVFFLIPPATAGLPVLGRR